MRISMQKLLTGANLLPQLQGKQELCKSNSDCKKAYDSLTKSAVAALNCFLELKDALIENNSAIAETGATQEDGKKKESKTEDAADGSSDSLWKRMDIIYSSITPYRNSSVDRWQRKTQLATGAAAVKGRFQAFNQSISQQLTNALRNPDQLVESIRSTQSKEQETPGLVDNSGALVATTDGTNEQESAPVVDDSEFYQQLLVEFLESSNPGALGGIQRRQHTKKRKIVDRRASKGRKIRYNVLEPLVNFMAPEPMELPPMASKLFANLFGQRSTPVS